MVVVFMCVGGEGCQASTDGALRLEGLALMDPALLLPSWGEGRRDNRHHKSSATKLTSLLTLREQSERDNYKKKTLFLFL